MYRTVFGGSTRTIAVGDPLGDFLVPLLLGLAVEETNDDHGHVVAAYTSGLGVRGKAVVHHVFADLFEVLLSSNAPPDELDHGLGRLAVPDTYTSKSSGPSRLRGLRTIASKNQELIFVRKVVLFDIWEGGYDLVLR